MRRPAYYPFPSFFAEPDSIRAALHSLARLSIFFLGRVQASQLVNLSEVVAAFSAGCAAHDATRLHCFLTLTADAMQPLFDQHDILTSFRFPLPPTFGCSLPGFASAKTHTHNHPTPSSPHRKAPPLRDRSTAVDHHFDLETTASITSSIAAPHLPPSGSGPT